MRVFFTGGTGFIGSAIVQELIQAGHRVLGLARSDKAASALAAAGAEVHRGDLEDPDSLKRGVAAAEGVIHNGFIHDFARFKEVCEIERRAIEALGAAVLGSDRPLVITSGTALIAPGRLANENDAPGVDSSVIPRVVTEETAASLAARGARVSLVRLSPSVHGEGDHGFVPTLISIAREKGVSAYIGDGRNRWNAVHRLDAARLFKLALEKAPAGTRLHAVAEEAVAFREIAEVIGRRLDLPVVSKSPEEAASHFGWFAPFAGLDCPASSKLTQERFGWRPVQPSLIADLESGSYFKS
ncbi:SDR family oxidoreductase [Archangium violaceum]|uniref:SDR family oxidoreductase n=1 Tax=Archangium violaceum TaxID=83451 RepID=UPI001951EAE0|nr:SDR family oxidoreductase [Archangium violaceum]QRN97018.1 SDR family oxidoreductase [Archangium violaceum]